MTAFNEVLDRLEELLEKVEQLDEPVRDQVFELLDGIDFLHRTALARLVDVLGADQVERLREDPGLAWLLDAYAVGIDEKAAADAALESIRPYIHSHGGRVEVIDCESGVVRLRMSGACAGCTASAVTLQEGIEQALQENFPGFVAIEVEEDDAPAHPPPGATLLQIKPPGSTAS